jgi:pilus assembly protein Flp/PilA
LRGSDTRRRLVRGAKPREARNEPFVARGIKDESGTTAIEYALIGVGISVAILAAVQAVGGSVSGFYDKVAAEVAKM